MSNEQFTPWQTWGDVSDEDKARILASVEPFEYALTLAPTDAFREAFKKIAMAMAILLLCCLPARATTAVTGNIKTLGTGVSSVGTFVRFYLRGCAGEPPRIPGVGSIAPTLGNVYYFDFPAASNGAITGILYSTRDATGLLGGDIFCFDDNLQAEVNTSVWYGMQVFVNGKGGAELPIHALNTATIDVSTVSSLLTIPVVTPPAGDTVYCRLDAGNCGITGSSITISGARLGISSTLFNTFFGLSTLAAVTTGQGNTAIGRLSGSSLTTGQFNTALGYNTLINETGGTFPTGGGNNAIGAATMQGATTGYYNDAIGYSAMSGGTVTGFQNEAMGQTALAAATTAHDNVAIGAQALTSDTTGQDNTCVGSAACETQTTAFQNTCLGTWCLAFVGTGTDNTALGHDAGRSLTTTATENIMIGSYTGYNCGAGLCGTQLATASNCIVIGFQEYCTANNQTFWGNTSNTQLNVFADPANASNGSGGISLNQPLQVSTDSLELNQPGTTSTIERLFRGGVQKHVFGNEGTASNILTGAAQDDFSLRLLGSSANFNFGNTGGSVTTVVAQAGGLISKGTAAGLAGTGACATITNQVGGAWAGSAKCTGTTGASTLTITFATTAPNGWACNVQDETTRANAFQQTSHTQTTCVLTVTSVTQNDIFVFTGFAF